jgi:hypothetical protein
MINIKSSRLLCLEYEKVLKRLFKLDKFYIHDDTSESEDDTAVKVILILHNLNYKFSPSQSDYYIDQFLKYLKASGNNLYPISEDFKKTIQIMFTNYNFHFYGWRIKRFSNSDFGKNPALHYCLQILFESKYKFTPHFVTSFCSSDNQYKNQQIEEQTYLNYNLIVYCILSLSNSVKIDQIFINNVLNLINTSEIQLNYVTIMLQSVNFLTNAINNDDKIYFVTALLNKFSSNTNNSDINTVLKLVIKHNLKNDFILKIILQNNVLNTQFINLLCSNKILHKNMLLLFYAMTYNYVPTLDLINNLLEISETCKCNHLIFQDDCKKYIGDCKFKCMKMVKIIDCLDLFNVIPSEKTLKIALNNGYIYTVKQLITKYNFMPNNDTLNEAAKSKNIDLIKIILSYKIDPTELTLQCLVSETSTKIRRKLNKKYSRKFKRKRGEPVPESYIITIVRLLIANGLKINLNCISMLLSIYESLDNLEDYGIAYDEDLYFICHINDYFPIKYIEKFTIDKHILTMRQFTDHDLNTDTKIIDFIKTNNIKLDNYMLEHFMDYHNNGKLYSCIFNDNNCVPSLISMYKNYLNNNMLKKYIDDNNFTKDVMLKTHDIVF